MDKYTHFIRESYGKSLAGVSVNSLENDIKSIMSKESPELSYDLPIDMTMFIYSHPEAAQGFYAATFQFIEGLKSIVDSIQKQILTEENIIRYRYKSKVVIRLDNIPELGDLRVPDIKSIDHKHLNKFVILTGTIIRVSKPKNREVESQVA